MLTFILQNRHIFYMIKKYGQKISVYLIGDSVQTSSNAPQREMHTRLHVPIPDSMEM